MKPFANTSRTTDAARVRNPVLGPTPSIDASIIDPLCDPEWDRQIASHPNSTFFHSSAWAKVLSHTYGHVPFYLRLVRDGQLVALVPVMEVRSPLTGRRGVCLPFTDVCGPLLFEDGARELVHEELLK